MVATIFNIDFDFSSAPQNAILQELQAGGYQLMGYKGATGPKQIKGGLPTWFAIPYTDMLTKVDIEYEPEYKVFVGQVTKVGANTTLVVSSLSGKFPLGTALELDESGNFTIDSNGSAPAGTISLYNNRPASTPDITVGLAAKVNGKYSPFCAFTLTPQGSLDMEPLEKVCLFAAQTNLVSGSVVGNAATPGCTFDFDSSDINYQLEMIPVTFGITEVPGTTPVTRISSGDSLAQLLNS